MDKHVPAVAKHGQFAVQALSSAGPVAFHGRDSLLSPSRRETTALSPLSIHEPLV